MPLSCSLHKNPEGRGSESPQASGHAETQDEQRTQRPRVGALRPSRLPCPTHHLHLAVPDGPVSPLNSVSRASKLIEPKKGAVGTSDL